MLCSYYSLYYDLIRRYIIFDKYDKAAKILDNPDIYSSGLEKKTIEIFKAVILVASGKGKEAAATLLEIATTTGSKKVKAYAYEQLSWIYDKGVGIKKNKKLSGEYSQKRFDALYE